MNDTHKADHHHTNRRVNELSGTLNLLQQRVEGMAVKVDRATADNDAQVVQIAELNARISVLEARARTALWALGAAVTLLTQLDKLIEMAAALA